MKFFKKKDFLEPENKYQEVTTAYLRLEGQYIYLEELYNKANTLNIIDQELNGNYYKIKEEVKSILNNIVYKQISVDNPDNLMFNLDNYRATISSRIIFNDYIENIENNDIDKFKPVSNTKYLNELYNKKQEEYRKNIKGLQLLFSGDSGQRYLQDMLNELANKTSLINNLVDTLEELINMQVQINSEDEELEELEETGNIAKKYAEILASRS